MKQLLKADFRRIFKQKLIYILFGLSGLASILVPLPFALGNISAQSNLYSASFIIENIFSTSFMLGLVIPILSAVIIYQDHGSGIIRNKLMAGYKRTEIFYSNLVINFILTYGMLLTTCLTSTLIALIFMPFAPEGAVLSKVIIEVLANMLINFCITVCTVSLTTMLATGLKNLPLAIIIPYVLTSIGTVICSIGVTAYSINYYNEGQSNLTVCKILELINYYGGRDYILTGIMTSVFSNSQNYSPYDLYHILAYTILPLSFTAVNILIGIEGFKHKDLK